MDDIRLFLQGVKDGTLEIKPTWDYYMNGSSKEQHELKAEVWNSWVCTLQSVAVIWAIDYLCSLLCELLPADLIISGLAMLIKVLIYTDNIVRQTVYIQKITTLAVKIEVDIKENNEYLIYVVEGFQNTMIFFEKVNLIIKALLFSIILLVQTSVLDIVILLIPGGQIKGLVIVTSWFLYSVYISVGLYSLKIVYQNHLPYYFHRNIAYLGGLFFFWSVVLLNYSGFPYLGLCLSLLTPVYLLQVMRHDPPFYGTPPAELEPHTGTLDRRSYRYHIYHINKDRDPRYREASQNMRGWFVIPRLLQPYAIQLVKPTVSSIEFILKRTIFSLRQ